MASSVPRSKFGEVAEDHEIWEETDGGARFKLTRHVWERLPSNEIMALSISGVQTERDRILREFSEVFGEPYTTEADAPDGIDTYLWLFPLGAS